VHKNRQDADKASEKKQAPKKGLRRKERPLDPSKLDYSDTGRFTEEEN
jgi:hypothetical protein